jgi:hypothetical protein
VRDFPCPHCEYSASRNYQLEAHVRRIHKSKTTTASASSTTTTADLPFGTSTDRSNDDVPSEMHMAARHGDVNKATWLTTTTTTTADLDDLPLSDDPLSVGACDDGFPPKLPGMLENNTSCALRR